MEGHTSIDCEIVREDKGYTSQLVLPMQLPESDIRLAKAARVVSQTLAQIPFKLQDEILKGIINIRWDVVRSFCPPGRSSVEDRDTVKVPIPDYRT